MFKPFGNRLGKDLELRQSQLREQTQHHRKSRPLTVVEVVVVENGLKNWTLWSLTRQENSMVGECCESTKERRSYRPESTPEAKWCLTRGAPSAASFSSLEKQQGEEKRSEREEKRFL
ncbi:hypothetical protein TNCV_2440601 [Trichonephila clavipes]|nr:hypothetical protein TNCV_2440601 [Trichonephila clavipes]